METSRSDYGAGMDRSFRGRNNIRRIQIVTIVIGFLNSSSRCFARLETRIASESLNPNPSFLFLLIMFRSSFLQGCHLQLIHVEGGSSRRPPTRLEVRRTRDLALNSKLQNLTPALRVLGLGFRFMLLFGTLWV